MKLSRPSLAAAAAIFLIELSTTPTLSAQDKGPAAPTRLWAAQTSPTTVTLAWQLAAGAAGYNVFGPRPKSGNTGGSELLARLGSNASRYVAPLVGAGVTHQYFIQAVDAKGQVSQKAEFNPVVPPAKQATSSAVPVPSFLKAEVTGPGEITLRWDGVPGATAYAIGRSVRPQGIGRLCELCPTETTYVDRDAVAGAVHVYRVIAIAPQGTSRPVMSNEVTPAIGKEAAPADPKDALPAADPKEGAPKAPTGVRATVLTPTSIQLSWITGTGTATLQIKRKVGVSAAQLIATVNGTVSSFLDQLGNAAGGMISYQLIAVNAKGAAEAVSVTVDPAKAATDSTGTPPKAATGLKATVISPTGIRLSWIAGLAGGMYQLMRQVSPGPPQVIGTFPGTVSNFLDHFPPGAMPGMIGYWVEAVDGKSAASEKVTISTDPSKQQADSSPPSPPTDLKAAVTAPYTVTLSWKPVEGATYQIKRGGLLGPVITVVESISSTVGRFVDLIPPELWKGRSIVYTIIAITRGIGGGFDNPKTASAPATVTVTIDPEKAGAAPPPTSAAPDPEPQETDIDSLPRPRPRPRVQ